MQSLARDGLTADEVRAILMAPSIETDWGVDLLDSNDQMVRALDTVTECTVYRQMYAAVHGTTDLTLLEDLDWPNVRVRPWQSVGGVRFDLGVFGLETPETAGSSGVRRVQGYDKLAYLQRLIGDSFWAAKSAPGSETYYLDDVVRRLITDSGLTGTAARIQSDADAVEIVSAFVQALDLSNPATYLRAINDGLAAVAYRGLWMDETGAPRSIPYVAPSDRAVEWTWDLADPATNILGPEWSITDDNWHRATAWMFVRRGMTTLPTDGSGLYFSPSKTAWDAAGAVRAVYEMDAASQTSLEAQGDQQVRTDSARTRLVEVTCGPLPCLAHFDIGQFTAADYGVDVKVQVRRWSQRLHYSAGGSGGPVSLTLEVV